MKNISIFGSTGSIGSNAVKILLNQKNDFNVVVLTGGKNLNELAKNGIVYDNFYAVSPVCAPSRSSIITGMYPTTIGTQHMRAYKKNIALQQF